MSEQELGQKTCLFKAKLDCLSMSDSTKDHMMEFFSDTMNLAKKVGHENAVAEIRVLVLGDLAKKYASRQIPA